MTKNRKRQMLNYRTFSFIIAALLLFTSCAKQKEKNTDLVKTTVTESNDLVDKTQKTNDKSEALPIGTEQNINGYELKLVWSDEFDGSSNEPDPAVWSYDLGRGEVNNSDGTNNHNWAWGNNEVQSYTQSRENAWVEDGSLFIKAIKQKTALADKGTWTSARLVTRGKKEFTYGYLEIRVKIPKDRGAWPALWMLRHDHLKPNSPGWPKIGEIDIMESAASLWGINAVYSALHCQAGFGGNPVFTKGGRRSDISQWHTCALAWTEHDIRFYFDDIHVGTYRPLVQNEDTWPFDQDFYFLMNVAMGGNLGGAINPNINEVVMEVDYIRHYEFTDPDSLYTAPPVLPDELVIFGKNSFSEGFALTNWGVAMPNISEDGISAEYGGGWGTAIAITNPSGAFYGYSTLEFKIKTDKLAHIFVKVPEVEKAYPLSSGTALGDGWVQMRIPLDFFGAVTVSHSQFAIHNNGTAGDEIQNASFQIKDIVLKK